LIATRGLTSAVGTLKRRVDRKRALFDGAHRFFFDIAVKHDHMSTSIELIIDSIRVRPVVVPLHPPIQTSGQLLTVSPLVLIDLSTREGVIGRSYVASYTPAALKPLADLITAMGEWLTGDRVAPVTIYQKLQLRLRLLGPQGLAGMAAGGIDMAAWDALARAAELPLVRLLGGEPRPITAYASLRAIRPTEAADEAGRAAAAGFTAVKLKIGHGTLASDLEAIRAVRQAVGADRQVMVDYNQCLTVPEALRRVRVLDEEGLYWIEEPVRAHDFKAHARVAREARTAIQTGESWWGPSDAANCLAVGGCDHAMLNAMKIGGVTGWVRAAALAEAAGVPVSSHIFPEFSAHLLAVSPTGHWLEFFDFAAPLLLEPVELESGRVLIRDTPGVGLDWDEKALSRF
jgi:mandelate racemase